MNEQKAREAAIEAAGIQYETGTGDNDFNEALGFAFDAGYAHAASVWTRIEDGLPTEPGEYDVTFSPSYSKPFVVSVNFFDKHFYHSFDFEPIAWRLRPAPYNPVTDAGDSGEEKNYGRK